MVYSFRFIGKNTKTYNNSRSINKRSHKINIVRNLANELSDIKKSKVLIQKHQMFMLQVLNARSNYKFTRYTKEEQNDLFLKAKNGDLDSRNELWESCYFLVYWLANRIALPTELSEDCIQEGLLAIPDALEKFDPLKNSRFTSYLIFHIFKRIQIFLHEQRFFLKYPHYCYVFFMKYISLTDEAKKEFFMRKYNIENIDDLSSIPSHLQKSIVLSASIQENNFDFIGREDENHKTRDINDVATYIEWGMNKVLKKKEREVLRFYFGFDGERKNLRQIGLIYNVCRERIRQIINKGCQKLKDYLENKNIF